MFRAGDKFDKYTITGLLGEGGMGLVYEAQNPFGVKVVLKMLHPELTGQPQIVERFRREGRIQYTLRHPNIVRVTDIVESKGVPALVVDFMAGEDLEAAMAKRRIPMADAVRITEKMLDALQNAHDYGFIHRDIKPSNIFLEATSYGFEPRLMDFGIAKIEDAAALTRAREFCGTPAYTSPEQIQSTKDVDGRTDVYSFGVVLWEMLCGKEPYVALKADPYAVLAAVVREPLPRLPETVPLWLRKVVERATRKNPDERFQTAREFREALLSAAAQSDELAGTMVIPNAENGDFLAASVPAVKTGGVAVRSPTPMSSNALPDIGDLGRSSPGSAQRSSSQPLSDDEAAELARLAFGPLESRQIEGQRRLAEKNNSSQPNLPAKSAKSEDDEDPYAIDIHSQPDFSPSGSYDGDETLSPTQAPPPREPARSTGKKQTVLIAPRAAMKAGQIPLISGNPIVLIIIVASILAAAGVAFAVYRFANRPEAPPAGFARIPAGKFMMGSPESEAGRKADESLHEVTITRPFAMMQTEVTQQQWQEVMFGLPSKFTDCGGGCPIQGISWFNAADFANQLSIRDGLEPCYEISGNGGGATVAWPLGLACTGYRLPTEAEWEYAARGTQDTAFSSGEISYPGRDLIDPKLNEVAWYGANSGVTYKDAVDCSAWNTRSATCGTQPVRGRKANLYGLYDMHGNVAEWVWDFMGPSATAPQVDPTGPAEGANRLTRGGSWMDSAADCRAAARSPESTIGRPTIGVRLVKTLRN